MISYSLTAPTLLNGIAGIGPPMAVIRPRLTVARIQDVVSAFFNLHPSSMVSARRSWDIARPRQIAMYLAYELTPKSMPDIGRRFGNRDHTTVIHAIKRIKHFIATDDEIADDVAALRQRLAA